MTVPTKSSWHPASSFGWIDIDRDEAKRVREMLGLFTTPEAIDPHGILPLQIALSERLFPGMSTQHTRARYVMFAAWHAQRLAVHRSARTPHEQLRVDEVGLMRSLLDSTDNAGVFGRRNREKTKTLPTSVYWGLLQKWKIIAPDLTIADIGSQIDTARARRERGQRSDDAETWADPRLTAVLPTEFPPPPDGFPFSDQTLQLTTAEVDYLRDRVAASCKQSFLHEVFSTPELATGEHPWSIDPDRGGQDLVDARCFSELIHPARLLYTKLLVADARKLGRDLGDIDEAITRDFAQWRQDCDHRTSTLQRWADSRLVPLLSEPDVRLSGTRKTFIETAIRLTAADPNGCLESKELERRVRSIERDVKRNTARLRDGEPFRRWVKNPTRLASRRLDYRWSNVCRFVDDLNEAS